MQGGAVSRRSHSSATHVCDRCGSSVTFETDAEGDLVDALAAANALRGWGEVTLNVGSDIIRKELCALCAESTRDHLNE